MRKTMKTTCRCGAPNRPNQRNCAGCHRAAQKKHRATHPLVGEARRRANARAYAKVYLRRGVLKREPCEICGARAEMHHDDYTKPLAVRWLCRADHLAHHRAHDSGAGSVNRETSLASTN